jgi:hypothetical protein
MAKRKTTRKNRKTNKKMKGGIGIGDMPKVYHLYKIIKSKKPDSEKEEDFIKYVGENKKLLTDKGIGAWNGNIMHLLAEGENTNQKPNPPNGCIEIPWYLKATSGYIKEFDDFLNEHPRVVSYIRKNTTALSDLDDSDGTPLRNARYCDNSIMVQALSKPASPRASISPRSGTRKRSGSSGKTSKH